MNELEECPFCGKHGRMITQYSGGRPGYKEIGPPRMHYVECQGCLARGPRHPIRDEAANRWNQATVRTLKAIEDEIYMTLHGHAPLKFEGEE